MPGPGTPHSTSAAWTLIASSYTTGVSPFTTAALDTTGANLLVSGIAYFDNGGATVSDSKSNTWDNSVLSNYSPFGPSNQGFVPQFVLSPTVGTGHTFTFTGPTSSHGGLIIAAFKSATGTPTYDYTTGIGQAFNATFISTTTPTLGAGTVAPTVTNDLVVAHVSTNSSTTTYTIDSGLTIAQQTPGIAGQIYSQGLAWGIRSTSSSFAPTWTLGGGGDTATLAVIFIIKSP